MPAKNITLPVLSVKEIERFWSKVRIGHPDACWPWTGSVTHNGYGKFYLQGDIVVAHRVALFLFTGNDPGDLLARHLVCDNPPCCNGRHLAPGTYQQNTADMISKGRRGDTRTFGNQNGSRRRPESRPRGENHGRAILSDAQVVEIRSLKDIQSGPSLAKRFGVGNSQIYRILKGKHRS